MSTRVLKVVRSRGLSIFRQLQFEEILLKRVKGSFCFLNRCMGAPGVAFSVLLSYQDARTTVNLPNLALRIAKSKDVRLIHRFTPGGVSIVDENTSFVSFISNEEDLGSRNATQWSKDLFEPVFAERGLELKVEGGKDFTIRPSDGSGEIKKIAANAQTTRNGRFVHQTSFLWDYNAEAVTNFLLPPTDEPTYRGGKSEAEFLGSLRSHFDDNYDAFEDRIFERIEEEFKDWKIEVYSAEDMEAEYGKIVKHLDDDILAGKIEGCPGNRGAMLNTEDVTDELMANHFDHCGAVY